jgi:hypothetical protein
MPLRETLTNSWEHIQGFLFPMLREEVGPLTTQHERLVVVLDVARVETFVRMWSGLPGRPPADRHALARAFVAKAVLDLATTSGLVERLAVDATLRRLCGWERASQVPSESTFSRAFNALGRAARMHAVDPFAGKLGERQQILVSGEPMRFEASHLTGRRRTPMRRLAADNPTHRRIMPKLLGVVHVFIAGESPEDRLPKHPNERVPAVLAGAGVGERFARHRG